METINIIINDSFTYFRYSVYISHQRRGHEMIEQFKSPFRTERQWYFTQQYSLASYPTTEIFYSIQPYRYRRKMIVFRRRDYILNGENKQLNLEFFC